MIKVENLKKVFYLGEVEVHALRGVSFEIPAGEFIGIMGKSGSGKSTLLRQLGLIDEPTTGNIYFDDKHTRELSDNERSQFRLTHLGYIFQEFALIPELTALENVMLPAIMKGDQRAEFEKHATELLETVDLGDRIHHRPKELSGGQQQRVAIARALINSPQVVFADEPTASLDSTSSEIVMKTFKKLNAELKQTIILVTHEPDDEVYLDRVLVMKDGKLLKEHTTKKPA